MLATREDRAMRPWAGLSEGSETRGSGRCEQVHLRVARPSDLVTVSAPWPLETNGWQASCRLPDGARSPLEAGEGWGMAGTRALVWEEEQ